MVRYVTLTFKLLFFPQTLQKHRHHPPILQDNSQTLAAPFKELSHHRTPSESIGNNYSPRAQGLKINKLQHIPISKSLAKPVGPSCSSNIKPRCRPMSPQEQLDILHREEETMRAMQTEPTERDLERYTYYIANGVPSSLLATQPLQQMMNIMRQLPPETEDSNIQVKIMRENMKEEVTRDYCFTLRKSIVDYILMDPSECQRLSICSIPKPFPRRVIRGPVPWHTSYRKVYTWQNQHLFTVSQIMILLQDIWLSSWLPHCASIIDTSQALWLPLTHEGEQEALVIVKEFFSCVAALMSMQLRSLVVESLQDLLYIFTKHEDGNDFGEVFDEMKYIQSEVLQVELQVKEPHIDFSPSLQECWEFIHRGFMQIIKSAEKIPRVQYLSVYQKYSNLLDHTAIQEISSFLNDRQSLEGFRDKIESFNHLRQEIASLHVTVPLSMFCLHAGKLNDDLCGRAERLKDKIIMFEMKEHRELNEGICRKYEEITETIRSTPETTEELVSLNQYINITSNVTTRKLMDEIDEARFHLSFLLDYATLPPDDLKLNACVYHWPNNILTELEDSRIHLATMKEQAQDFLQNRFMNTFHALSHTTVDTHS
ncbi:dynein axonemal heavy chain 3-like [Pungitius pungitius]|uniref:dynein axonemal heavy chain 3-like n=1 Tax=Pungitius pungitius TaxID=134920 RepID=UPI002E1623C6